MAFDILRKYESPEACVLLTSDSLVRHKKKGGSYSIVGSWRMPGFEDAECLTYIDKFLTRQGWKRA